MRTSSSSVKAGYHARGHLLSCPAFRCFRRWNSAGEAVECFNPIAAVMRAEALSRKEGYVGAVAFSRSGNLATGDFSDATVIRKFGEVPDDLSAL
jgi:hypothetical protein